jgi:hypothetical protein
MASKTFTTVTKFSKTLAFVLFITLPFLGFYLGYEYNQGLRVNDEKVQTPSIAQSTNIKLLSPRQGQTVSIPFTIRGEARVFENQLNYRVKDAKGTVLLEGNTMANSPDVGQFGPFEVEVKTLDLPKGSKIKIEVFTYSPKDGSEIDNVSIEVILK